MTSKTDSSPTATKQQDEEATTGTSMPALGLLAVLVVVVGVVLWRQSRRPQLSAPF